MKNLGLDVLEMFARLSEEYRERQIFKAREGYVPIVKHDIAKRQWREDNKDLQRMYARREYYKRTGRPELMPSIVRVKVEIFWDDNSFYFAKPNDSERLGGPFKSAHEAWKKADREHYEVIDLLKTRGNRSCK